MVSERADCHVSRRQFMQMAGAGFVGFMAAHSMFAQDEKTKPQPGKSKENKKTSGKAKHCIVLWMSGGPSQLDTWDPKKGVETSGEFKSIPTAVKGVEISEHLPRMAEQMDKVSLIRTVTSPEGEHFRAAHLLHTANRFIQGFPYPSLGSIVSYEIAETGEVPNYVTVGERGFGASFLGEEHAPFSVENPSQALDDLRKLVRQKKKMELLKKFDEEWSSDHASSNAEKRKFFIEKLDRLLESSFSKALDLSQESDDTRKEYGKNGFGQGCLLARRLLEAGVRFVEVNLGGWDTHQDNFKLVKERLSVLDPGFAALVKDLHNKDMLKETLVVWMGEFGRTPDINANKGRDHYPQAFSVVLAGGGIMPGRVIGQTDKVGKSIANRPVSVHDMFATMYSCFGIDFNKKLYSPFGSVVKLTDKGAPVKELLA